MIIGGMVFGYFYMVTKSLYTSVGMHFALDGYAGVTNSIFHYSKVNVDQLDLYSAYTLIVVLTVLFWGLKFYRYKVFKPVFLNSSYC
ncbi:hypothetical protein [Sporolactobacillus pectinivorans]|uniref:hypothetical protein n=1 Tax=Sporolactobacillus pectinivorans TaxID=1591408 RepID=UPI003B8494C2